MPANSEHFEVFARRAGGGFGMEQMLLDREAALTLAEEMFASGEVVAVRVTREALDPDTGEFRSKTLLKKGPQDEPRAGKATDEAGPPCRTVQDLYSTPARAQIQRLLEVWLARARATPFELLHRPELAMALDESGQELQHAMQKCAVPQSLARGVSVHEVIRLLQRLTEQAVNRLQADQRKGQFVPMRREEFAPLCQGLEGAADRHYLLGGGVAGFIASATGWNDKVERLLELAEAAPADGPARDLAFQVLARGLGDLLGAPAAMAELLGSELDLGGRLSSMTRLAAAETVEALIDRDPTLEAQLPPLSPTAQRLAGWFAEPRLAGVRQGLGRRIVRELGAPRRLRPSDPTGEVAMLRALQRVLGAAAEEGILPEGFAEVLVERSRTLVSGDFITAYLGGARSALYEVFDLARLLDAVAGDANRQQTLRWLESNLAGLRFETEMLTGPEPPAVKLASLARLHRQLQRVGQGLPGLEGALERICTLGGRVEAEAKLTRLLAQSSASTVRKLDALLKMARGETAPPGAVAERARAEAKRLITSSAANAEMTASPEVAAQVRAMMKSFQAAA